MTTTSTASRRRAGAVIVLVGVMSALALLAALLLSGATRSAEAAAPSGKAFSWGYNYSGQLGNGTSGAGTNTNTPGAVSNLKGVKSVKGGCQHGLALLNDGTVRAWGEHDSGQLSNGTTDASNVPVKVKNLTGVKAVSAGCYHNLALKNDGSVWAWGENDDGQLGNGTNDDSNVPVRVGSLGTGANGIAAGDGFSLALMKNGTVNSWGYNGYGQLGNGTNTPRNTPGPVSFLSNVKAIATDGYANHALALLNDGAVRAWGNNDFGQLGDGTSGSYRATPVAVYNLPGVKAIAAGGDHSLALLGSGRVKSWGYNYDGQLGNGGDGTYRQAPGDVIGLSDVRSISGGEYHSLAVLESGKARSWGYNGDGTDSNYPVEIDNLANVKNIDGGEDFTLATTE